MKTFVMIDGHDGTGKTTLSDLFQEKFHPLPKFRKNSHKVPSNLKFLVEKFSSISLNNPMSSLGLQYYVNFTVDLEESLDANNRIIADRGLVSLGIAGHYGYHLHKEKIPWDRYRDLETELLRDYLEFFNQNFDISTKLFMLTLDKEKALERIRKKEKLCHADYLFIDNFDREVKAYNETFDIIAGYIDAKKLDAMNTPEYLYEIIGGAL